VAASHSTDRNSLGLIRYCPAQHKMVGQEIF
jgi:hypothetical protein